MTTGLDWISRGCPWRWPCKVMPSQMFMTRLDLTPRSGEWQSGTCCTNFYGYFPSALPFPRGSISSRPTLHQYNLTINYYMVKLTNHKKAIDRPLSCKRWGIIAIIIFFAGSLSFLLYSYFSHDVDNPQCSCLLCMLNHVPEEGEYIYNRYLIFISFIWIAVIFAAVFLVNYCFVKKNKKK